MTGSVFTYSGVSLGKGDVHGTIHPLRVLHQGGPAGVWRPAHSLEVTICLSLALLLLVLPPWRLLRFLRDSAELGSCHDLIEVVTFNPVISQTAWPEAAMNCQVFLASQICVWNRAFINFSLHIIYNIYWCHFDVSFAAQTIIDLLRFYLSIR